jgi:hypothetical protein
MQYSKKEFNFDTIKSMKMKSLFLSVLIFSFCIITSEGCKKPGGTQITSGGGTGGTSTLIIIPEHHGALLDSCMIYIKYGTLDAPVSGIFDDSIKCTLQVSPADTTPAASFPNLTNGIYYLYAQGFHPGYGPVKGGLSWTISNQNTSGTVYLQTATYN